MTYSLLGLVLKRQVFYLRQKHFPVRSTVLSCGDVSAWDTKRSAVRTQCPPPSLPLHPRTNNYNVMESLPQAPKYRRTETPQFLKRQKIPPKRSYLSTRLHGLTPQNTASLHIYRRQKL